MLTLKILKQYRRACWFHHSQEASNITKMFWGCFQKVVMHIQCHYTHTLFFFFTQVRSQCNPDKAVSSRSTSAWVPQESKPNPYIQKLVGKQVKSLHQKKTNKQILPCMANGNMFWNSSSPLPPSPQSLPSHSTAREPLSHSLSLFPSPSHPLTSPYQKTSQNSIQARPSLCALLPAPPVYSFIP